MDGISKLKIKLFQEQYPKKFKNFVLVEGNLFKKLIKKFSFVPNLENFKSSLLQKCDSENGVNSGKTLTSNVEDNPELSFSRKGIESATTTSDSKSSKLDKKIIEEFYSVMDKNSAPHLNIEI